MARKRTIGKDILRRVRLLYVLFLLAGMMIVGRILWIQYGPDGEELREKAEDITFARFRIPAERGDILGRDGRILATTIPEYEIRMDFGVLNMSRDSFARVADTLGRCLARFYGDGSAAQYRAMLESNFADKDNKRYVRLNRRKISYTEEKQFAKFPLFRAGRYKSGYIAEQSSKRFLPMGSLARSVVGIMRDDEAWRGLEMRYDSLLCGTDGFTMKQKISGSFWIPVPDEGNMEPVNGYDIVTTIDADIQDVAERILRQQMEDNNGHWGTVILMEVATGEIIAMCNLGRLDDGSYGEVFNYAINTRVEPGSTFKLATMLSLLEVGGMRITDMVDCRPDPGKGLSARVGIRDIRDDHMNGVLTLRQTFEQSSNIGFARSAHKSFGHNPARFVDFVRDSLLMASPTGIDLAGERGGLIYHPSDRKNWHGTLLVQMAYGYNAMFTPLQILNLYNSVANDGRMMRPMLVKEVRSYGETIARFEPEQIRTIASPQTIRDAQTALAGVVMEGTGRLVMKGAPYTAVAKTGSAQQVIESGRGYRYPDGSLDMLCSFTGYFPVENPKYSCIVAIKAHEKRGTKRLYGSNVAGPVFRAVADRIYARTIELHDKSYGPEKHLPAAKDVKGGRTDAVRCVAQEFSLPYPFNDGGEGWWACADPEAAAMDAQTAVAGDTAVPAQDSTAQESVFTEMAVVPSVVGMGLKDAIWLLENAGLKVLFTGTGRVTAQSLRAGAHAEPGQTIQLTLKI